MRFIRQVMLPLAIVLALVAGVTFVSQYIGGPPWPRTQTGDDDGLNFVTTRAGWDADDPDYIREVERGNASHFDFWFRNPWSQSVEVVLRDSSAHSVELGMLAKADWKRADASPTGWSLLQRDGVVQVPGADPEHGPARGAIRVQWRRDQLGPARVSAELGLRRAGQPETRQRLEVPIRVVPAVLVQPARYDVGELPAGGARRAEFVCWSATRDAFELVEDSRPDDWTVSWKPLSAEQLRQVAEQHDSRPRCGYRVSVDLTDRGLELGPFEESPRLSVPLSDEVLVLTVAGVVRGSGRILTPGAKDRLDLGSFPRSRGARKALVLSVEPPARDLKLVSSPAGVAVKLTPLGPARWELAASVPANQPGGAVPPEAIVLEIDGPEPRRWRIPLMGQATQ